LVKPFVFHNNRFCSKTMVNRITWHLCAVHSQTHKHGSMDSPMLHGLSLTHTLRAHSKKAACHRSSRTRSSLGRGHTQSMPLHPITCPARETGSW
jgi:hypothetical protein